MSLYQYLGFAFVTDTRSRLRFNRVDVCNVTCIDVLSNSIQQPPRFFCHTLTKLSDTKIFSIFVRETVEFECHQ